MRNSKALIVATGGVIAAMYVVLTVIANALGLASGAIQVRFSEALTILPVFTPAAIPGLTVGCVLANLITGCAPWDVVFGSLATLIGALGTWLLRKKPMLAWIPPVLRRRGRGDQLRDSRPAAVSWRKKDSAAADQII